MWFVGLDGVFDVSEIKPWGYIHHSATRTLRDRALCNSNITKKATANSDMPLFTADQLAEAVAAERDRIVTLMDKRITRFSEDHRRYIRKTESRGILRDVVHAIRSTTK